MTATKLDGTTTTLVQADGAGGHALVVNDIPQYSVVTPDAQASVNADTVLDGSEIDMRAWRSLAYTLAVATNDVDWTVFGANLSTYADEVAAQAEATVTAPGVGSYAVAQAPFAFYRVKIHSNVEGVHGTATLSAVVKN